MCLLFLEERAGASNSQFRLVSGPSSKLWICSLPIPELEPSVTRKCFMQSSSQAFTSLPRWENWGAEKSNLAQCHRAEPKVKLVFPEVQISVISTSDLLFGELMWGKSWYSEDVAAQYCFLFKLQVTSRIFRKKRIEIVLFYF